MSTDEYEMYRHLPNDLDKQIGYSEAIKNEKRDGLVDVDFRKLKAPQFATQWPMDGWKYSRDDYLGNHVGFRWMADGPRGSAYIVANVCEDYECAQLWFGSKIYSSNMFPLPWVACAKKVGTACARAKGGSPIFFVYKNVFVDVAGKSHPPGQEDFAEVMAEWLFDTLKAAPLKPFHRGARSRSP